MVAVAARSAGAAAASSFSVRAVTYNVLSSHLSSPESYPTMDPFHLDPKNRLPVVLKKLEEEMNPPVPGNGKVVLCLQEVSYDWAGTFHSFFANKGYHFVTGLYGRKFNGYMGVSMAYPTEFFETIGVDITRLADEKPPPVEGWPPEELVWGSKDKKEEDDRCGFLNLSGVWKNLVVKPLRAIFNRRKEEEPDPMEHWKIAERRQNVMLTTTLRDKETGAKFVVGTYHMPCCFYNTKVMAIHSELAAQHIQRISKKQNLPYVLAGDWNLKPQDSTYTLLTTGKLSIDDPAYPDIVAPKPNNGREKFENEYEYTDWSPAIDPMRSVYASVVQQETTTKGEETERITEPSEPSEEGTQAAAASETDALLDESKKQSTASTEEAIATTTAPGEERHGEPEYTNYAYTRDDPPDVFCDTIDYIFVSPEWNINGVKELPTRQNTHGPLPNLNINEPSDHILLAADLELDNKEQ